PNARASRSFAARPRAPREPAPVRAGCLQVRRARPRAQATGCATPPRVRTAAPRAGPHRRWRAPAGEPGCPARPRRPGEAVPGIVLTLRIVRGKGWPSGHRLWTGAQITFTRVSV